MIEQCACHAAADHAVTFWVARSVDSTWHVCAGAQMDIQAENGMDFHLKQRAYGNENDIVAQRRRIAMQTFARELSERFIVNEMELVRSCNQTSKAALSFGVTLLLRERCKMVLEVGERRVPRSRSPKE